MPYAGASYSFIVEEMVGKVFLQWLNATHVGDFLRIVSTVLEGLVILYLLSIHAKVILCSILATFCL